MLEQNKANVLSFNDIEIDDNTTNPLFDQSSKTDQVLEMLDNDEILKSMWPIVKEYSKNMNLSKDDDENINKKQIKEVIEQEINNLYNGEMKLERK